MSESSRKKSIIATIGGICTAIAGTTIYQIAVDQLVIRPGQQVLTKFLAGQYEQRLQSGMSMVGSMIQNNPNSIATAANELAQANLPPAASNIQLQCRPLEGEEACLQRNTAELKAQLGWEKQQARLTALDNAYSACRDQTAQNPDIDLSAREVVYEANIRCLMADGYGKELAALAQNDANLAAIIAQAKQDLTTPPAQDKE
ncbi:hypothetical protein [Kingella sp. (in: b-proteobacteria)]|uniref:hypothetical protein n=1 Tax=Kingella sp. (in: b-proteobacteria) TaxID=2020713 RepID=UPI0026DADFF2|nr:hypothetical protein [Kingella sp. (in: b-proteobacteria)]MDO4657204.1 hypothetical protein [Kingella sp. (in: b-proteobacteria)]